ncbi:hypothetical protein [Brachyspira sp.]|uniref:hypothetical protein n=1 Tax=Brachyspira sp. TaxID=1977261 RepID=UPI003D7DA027
MNKEYVFPHCRRFEKEIKKIKNINRLFAFPVIPHFENNRLVILDSGAFGLSMQKKKMNKQYFFELSKYYSTYSKQYNRLLCIAPDVFKRPDLSMKNIEIWRYYNLFENITPVLQNSKAMIIDKDELKYQIDFYIKLNYKTLAYSIYSANGMLHKQQHIEEIFFYARKMGVEHIHCLGAGWNLEDIAIWKSIDGFDTFDSIAYYTTKNIDEFGSLNAIENIKNILALF